MKSPSTKETRLLVARQIGREPAIGFSVAKKCRYGWPAVIRNAPFDDRGNPNPNLYYLSCPYLRKRLGRLEGEGRTARLEELIALEPDLILALRQAQADHSRQWQEAAGGLVKTAPPGPRIAASSGDTLLKCLHAHFAYGFVHNDYKIGRLIAEGLEGLWCDDERCRHWMVEIMAAGGSGETS